MSAQQAEYRLGNTVPEGYDGAVEVIVCLARHVSPTGSKNPQHEDAIWEYVDIYALDRPHEPRKTGRAVSEYPDGSAKMIDRLDRPIDLALYAQVISGLGLQVLSAEMVPSC